MHHLGYSLHDIAQVTKHENIESLKFYLQQPTIEDMESYSDSLFQYASGTENTQQEEKDKEDSNFQDLPRPTRNIYDLVKKAKSPNSNHKIVPISPNCDDDSNSKPEILTQLTVQTQAMS